MHDLRIPYLHKNVATRDEFEFRLKEWAQPSFDNYPILYLAFHGSPGEFEIGGGKSRFDLVELEAAPKGACNGRVLHFGSCATLDLHGNSLNRLLRRIKAPALLGYKSDVDWLPSTAFDFLLLGGLQEILFTVQGIRKLDKRLNEMAFSLRRELVFWIHYDKARAKRRS